MATVYEIKITTASMNVSYPPEYLAKVVEIMLDKLEHEGVKIRLDGTTVKAIQIA